MSVLAAEPTQAQGLVLKYIRDFLADEGVPPTFRQIMTALGYASTQGVTCHLKPLVRKGLLRRVNRGGKATYMPVVEDGCCPCCGRPI